MAECNELMHSRSDFIPKFERQANLCIAMIPCSQ